MDKNGEIKIKKVHTALDLAVSAVMCAAGVGLYFVLPGWGILFCFIGVLLFGFYKRAIKREGENIALKEKSMDLAVGCREPLMKFLSGGEDLPSFELSEDTDHLYLELYYNSDAPVVYARLYDVGHSKFEPATEMQEIRSDRAAKLISLL